VESLNRENSSCKTAFPNQSLTISSKPKPPHSNSRTSTNSAPSCPALQTTSSNGHPTKTHRSPKPIRSRNSNPPNHSTSANSLKMFPLKKSPNSNPASKNSNQNSNNSFFQIKTGCNTFFRTYRNLFFKIGCPISLFNNHHFLCVNESVGFEPVEVNAACKSSGIEINSMTSCYSSFTYKNSHFASEHIIDFQ